jgi:uncharacterized protein (TIGR00369 family)
MNTPELLNKHGEFYLPGYMGIVVTQAEGSTVTAELPIQKCLVAPNNFLHAGTIVTLADTCAGYGASINLPEKATGFTTIELKSNFLGTALEGTIQCAAAAAHLGRQTQVWDAKVIHKNTGKSIALFRCTQMILYS